MNFIFPPSSDLSGRDNKVVCIFILFIPVVFIILQGNGKLYGNFVWLEMGLPNTEKDLNVWNGSVFTKFGSPLSGYNFFSICTMLACAQQKYFLSAVIAFLACRAT